MFYLEVIFSLGILSLPSTLLALGVLGGTLSIVGWSMLNTCKHTDSHDSTHLTKFLLDCAILVGNFRQNHTTCHSIADMSMVIGGTVLKEITGILFLLG